jgi:co-chaperonin GroES (HSP10)
MVGDTVFVHHFTFQGDIGQNRSFTEKEHIQYEGKDLYPVMKDKIFFKYNNDEIEPLGDFVIVEEVLTDEQTPSGIFLEQKPYKDRGRIIYALNIDLLGEVVLIENHALYPLEIKGKNYYRIYENEIAGFITTGEVRPSENRILVVDHDLEAKSSLLDLSFMAKPNTTKSTIVSVGKITHKMWDWAKIGETILRYAGSHIEFEGVKIVNLEQDRVIGTVPQTDF